MLHILILAWMAAMFATPNAIPAAELALQLPCPKCETLNLQDAKFCKVCGSELLVDESKPASSEPRVEARAAHQNPQAVERETPIGSITLSNLPDAELLRLVKTFLELHGETAGGGSRANYVGSMSRQELEELLRKILDEQSRKAHEYKPKSGESSFLKTVSIIALITLTLTLIF